MAIFENLRVLNGAPLDQSAPRELKAAIESEPAS
jgi:hypothetical protein